MSWPSLTGGWQARVVIQDVQAEQGPGVLQFSASLVSARQHPLFSPCACGMLGSLCTHCSSMLLNTLRQNSMFVYLGKLWHGCVVNAMPEATKATPVLGVIVGTVVAVCRYPGGDCSSDIWL